jgi:hypothetical protein
MMCRLTSPPTRTVPHIRLQHQKFRWVRQLMSYLAPAVKEPNSKPSFYSLDITAAQAAAHKSATFPGNLEAWFPTALG